MKNIFGLNKTLYTDVGCEDFDGSCFITKSLAEEAQVQEQKKPETPKLPAALSALQYIFVAIFAIALGIWLYLGKSLGELIKEMIYIPILMAAGFLGFVVLSVIEVIISKNFAKEHGIETLAELDEYESIHEIDEDAEDAEEERVKTELGIPEDAIDMDFLGYFYREDENGPYPIKPFDFMTLEMFAFADGDELHIADFNDV